MLSRNERSSRSYRGEAYKVLSTTLLNATVINQGALKAVLFIVSLFDARNFSSVDLSSKLFPYAKEGSVFTALFGGSDQFLV